MKNLTLLLALLPTLALADWKLTPTKLTINHTHRTTTNSTELDADARANARAYGGDGGNARAYGGDARAAGGSATADGGSVGDVSLTGGAVSSNNEGIDASYRDDSSFLSVALAGVAGASYAEQCHDSYGGKSGLGIGTGGRNVVNFQCVCVTASLDLIAAGAHELGVTMLAQCSQVEADKWRVNLNPERQASIIQAARDREEAMLARVEERAAVVIREVMEDELGK